VGQRVKNFASAGGVSLRRFAVAGSYAMFALLAIGVALADGPPRALGPAIPVATQPAPGSASPSQLSPESPNAQIFEGSGDFVDTAQGTGKKRAADRMGDITLDFSDADVRDVVRSVLGEMLKLPYVIDPQVNGHLTLKTGLPIKPEAVLPALETSLKTIGAAIVVVDDMVSIVPMSVAQKQAGQVTGVEGDNGAPGYGIEVVALKYVSADQMQKVLEPLVPQGGILRIDPQRNLIFLAGTEPERASIRNTIQLFDVDYLKGMSFALIQPQHVDVGTLATELGKIFDETSSPIAGLVRMIPISRINTLLVLTSRPFYLHEVSRWVARLDVIPITPGRQLHYYKLQNSRAADIAQTLGEIFGGSTGMRPPPAAAAPGQGYSASPPPPPAAAPMPASASSQMAPAPPAQIPASAGQGASNRGGDDSPQIVTDDANNALIIRADAAEYDAIEKIVRQMDVTPNQVLIEATIVEVTLNDTLKYGVEWAFTSGNQSFTQAATGVPTASFPGFGFTYMVPNVNVALSALGTLSKISVLSSPKLLTLDNSPASLEVGDQVPIVTQTSTSTDSSGAPVIATVQQRDTGVILSVTPRIGSSGMVFLTVSQEVSDAVPTTSSTLDQSPTVEERKIQTTVAIQDGTTVALGGLMRRSQTSGNSGVPYLKDIPVVGGLFGSQSDTRERTELMVFLTPRVVRSPATAVAVTDDIRRGLVGVQATMRDLDPKTNDIPRLPWR
jgi:general secretion pathway protein D